MAAVLLGGGLVAAACAPANNPPNLPVSRGSGLVTQVVASINDVGRMPSAAIDKDGNPAISYLLVTPNLGPSGLPPPIIPNTPQPPAVVVATFSSQQGYWVRLSASPQDYQKAKGTATELVDSKGYALPGVNTAIAVDSAGRHHVVWATPSGLFYTDDTATQPGVYAAPTTITKDAVLGAAITVASNGTPWVSYYDGNAVKVATGSGKKWTVLDVATTTSCTGCPPVRTGIGTAGDGRIAVAFTDAGTATPQIAEIAGTAKALPASRIASGSGGFGLSFAVGKDGTGHVAYYGRDGSVHEADSSGTDYTTWSDHAIAGAAAPSGSDTSGWSTGIGVDGSNTLYASWVDAASNRIMLAVGPAGTLAGKPVPGSIGGRNPSLAVSPDGKTLIVPFWDSIGKHLNVATLANGPLAVAVPSPSPKPPPTAPTGPPCAPTSTSTSLTISAANTAFNLNCLAVVPGAPFTVTFENMDSPGVPHNWALFTNAAATTAIADPGPTAAVNPGQSAKYSVKALDPGIYFFRCDFHPTIMIGSFVVAKVGPAPGPSSSP